MDISPNQPRTADDAPIRPLSSMLASIGHWASEFKRRRVPQTAATYSMVSLAGLELISFYEDILGIPTELMSFLALLAVFGLPVAILLSWMFRVTEELLPEGRTESAYTPPSAKAWSLAITSVVVALVAAWLIWRHVVA